MSKRILLSLLLVLTMVTSAVAVEPTAVYKRAVKSIVRVSYEIATEQKQRSVNVLGTVVTDKGLIVTSGSTFPSNVPMESFRDIKIHLGDDKPVVVSGEYLGQDSDLNLAFILAVPDDKTKPDWHPIVFDEKAEIETGMQVVTLGMLPEKFGYRPGVATGIVSAVIHKPETRGFLNVTGLATYGAPVYSEGEGAIGLVSSIEVQAARQVGRMRMPARSARVVIPAARLSNLIAKPPRGIVVARKPWLGVNLQNLDADRTAFLGLDAEKAVSVSQVIENSPASRAGLQVEDVILAVDGKPLAGMGDNPMEALQETIRDSEIGNTLALTVWRNQKEVSLKVTLAPSPQTAAEAPRQFLKDFGMTVRKIVLSDRMTLKLPADTKGLTVSYVEGGGWAASAGIRPGDILTKLAGKPVETVEDVRGIVEQLRRDKPEEVVALVIRDGKDTNILRIEPTWEK